MIAKGTDIQLYLPNVNWKMNTSRLDDFLLTAQSVLVDRVLGTELEQALEAQIAEGAEDTHAALRSLVKRALCQSAFLDAIPVLDLQLSEAGFVVQSNQAVSPASKERVEKLKEATAQRKSQALDILTRFLMDNSKSEESKYPRWRSTPQFEYLSCGIIFGVDEYKRNFATVKSFQEVVMTWDGYYKMIPKMKVVLHTIVAEYISEEYAKELLEKKRDAKVLIPVEREVLEYVCLAIVAGSIDNEPLARSMAIRANNIMKNHIDDFATFKNSDKYGRKGISLGGGAVANLL